MGPPLDEPMFAIISSLPVSRCPGVPGSRDVGWPGGGNVAPCLRSCTGDDAGWEGPVQGG